MPGCPEQVYRHDRWQLYGHWLDTGAVSVNDSSSYGALLYTAKRRESMSVSLVSLELQKPKTFSPPYLQKEVQSLLKNEVSRDWWFGKLAKS